MESIGASHAKSRLGELLDRTSRGESFQITKRGRSVAKLVPPKSPSDPEKIAQAVRRLSQFRGTFKGMTLSEFISYNRDGYRY